MNERNNFSALEQALMLQINERLFKNGFLTQEMHEQAKIIIVKRHT